MLNLARSGYMITLCAALLCKFDTFWARMAVRAWRQFLAARLTIYIPFFTHNCRSYMRVLWGFNGRIEALKIGCRLIVTRKRLIFLQGSILTQFCQPWAGTCFFRRRCSPAGPVINFHIHTHTTTMSLLNRVWSAFRPTIQTALSQSSATRPAGFSLPANAGSMRWILCCHGHLKRSGWLIVWFLAARSGIHWQQRKCVSSPWVTTISLPTWCASDDTGSCIDFQQRPDEKWLHAGVQRAESSCLINQEDR